MLSTQHEYSGKIASVLPLVQIPQTLQKHLQGYRAVFCRTAGFAQVSRHLRNVGLKQYETMLSERSV